MSVSSGYAIGHIEKEPRRLESQAAFLEEFTLRRAGIRSGIQVFDLGCGIGEPFLSTAILPKTILCKRATMSRLLAVKPAGLFGRD